MQLTGHTNIVKSIVLTSTEKLLISGSCDKTIKILDVQSGKILKTLLGHDYYVWSVAISPDSKLIVSGSEDKTIRIWSSVEIENYQKK